MYEHKSVGPNLKSYFYYTNEVAEAKNSNKGTIIIASGIEGTGKVFDEIGEYLDTKGYAMYAIDELGYGKTGKMVKSCYKNWKGKDAYYAAYNIHALSLIAKREHPKAPVILLGNDFGAMLCLTVIKEFPEIIDKVVTVGYGMPTVGDKKLLFASYIRKLFLYDNGESTAGHFGKNKYLGIRFEGKNKYSWLSSDLNQVKKIVNAGYIDTKGTVGHYFYYYKAKTSTPKKVKGIDKTTPMLFLSGKDDLTTLRGKKTKEMQKFFIKKKFTDVQSYLLSGRHELLFEVNRFDVVDTILNWIETNNVKEFTSDNFATRKAITQKKDESKKDEVVIITKTVGNSTQTVESSEKVEEVKPIIDLEEAEDELRINTHK